MTSALYQTGTVEVTAGSAVLSGTGTGWLANLRADNLVLIVAADGTVAVHRIAAVGGDEAASVDPVYAGASASGLSYMALQTHLMVPSLLSAVQALIDSLSSTLDVEGSNGLLTLAKALAGDSAGAALTTGGDYRWRWGAFGDDDFRLQRSADGVAWVDVIGIGRATGAVDLGASVEVVDLTVTGTITGPVREALNGPRTYFVSETGGDDANDGMTAGTAFATIQRGVDAVAAIDMAGHSATISVAPGTYAENVTLKDLVGGKCIIQGASGVASDVIVRPSGGSAFMGLGILGTWDLRNMQIGGSTSISRCIHMDSGRLDFRNINFDTVGTVFNQVHIYALGSAEINAMGDYAIIGGGGCHYYADGYAMISVANRTVSLVGSPNFTARFAVASTLGCVYLPNNTWSGLATGQRYFARVRATIFVNGAGATHLPGDAAGALSEDGYYV